MTDEAIAEAAKVIADLVACMAPWQQQNLNSVGAALDWLKANDQPELFLRCSVRDLMEARDDR